VLGIGGPEDLADIGRLDRLTWRYFVIEHPERGTLALAFTDMPQLMAFTRAMNARAPFTVPTECIRTSAGQLAEPGLELLVDPDSAEVATLLDRSSTSYRRPPLVSG
jgi:hypothetical protein